MAIVGKREYMGADTNPGPSPIIWARLQEICSDPAAGFHFFDDFLDFFASGSRYTLLEADGTASIGLIATETGGVLQLAITGTDNVECNLAGGINEGVLGKFTAGKRMGFETRIRPSVVTDNICGIVVGLTEEAGAQANLQADDTATLFDSDDSGAADDDYLAFRTLQADGNGLDIEYATAAAAPVIHKELAGTLVAATWAKAGWYFDGTTIKFYVNGSKVGTDLLITATSFPDGEEMHFFMGAKVGSDAALTLDCDWWRFAMER